MPQDRMDAAFDNYVALTNLLREDLVSLLDSESNSLHWRRNFIRVSASLIEGHVHCLREIWVVSFDCLAPSIHPKEAEALCSEGKFSANERLKFTLRAAYKLFELQPAPNFGGLEWCRALRVLEKRHLLMHPKNPADLHVSKHLWADLYSGVTWLIEQLFTFISALEKKHGQSSLSPKKF